MIADVICDYYKIDKESLFKKGRKGNIIKAKCLICYYAKTMLELSYMQIAQYFRHYEHSTILHRCRIISNCLQTKDYLYDDYCEIYKYIYRICKGDKTQINVTVAPTENFHEIIKMLCVYNVEIDILDQAPAKKEKTEVVEKKVVRMNTLSPADEVRRKYL